MNFIKFNQWIALLNSLQFINLHEYFNKKKEPSLIHLVKLSLMMRIYRYVFMFNMFIKRIFLST